MPKPLLGILETGTLPDPLVRKHGDYPAMMRDWLGIGPAQSRVWHVEGGALPDSPDEAEIWLITGSRHGAYEDHPWIAPLETFIRACRDAAGPMIGICFGHQIIAQALGGAVAKSAKGWGVGVHDYAVTNWPRELGPAPDGLHLQSFHQDQVEVPPEGAETVAASDFCEHAALFYPGFAVTFQAHPEFSPQFVTDLIAARRGVAFGDDVAQAGLANAAKADNRAELARLVRGWAESRKGERT